jgi:hypothetical protein
MDKAPDWVIVQRPGMTPERKGPFADVKHLEEMLRELYALYPNCTCTVISMPHTSYPEDGREWLSIYGDRRRKKPPEPNLEGRGLLLWALYHHQGGSSEVGQPIRRALGIGRFNRLTAKQIAEAKAAAGVTSNAELRPTGAGLSRQVEP